MLVPTHSKKVFIAPVLSSVILVAVLYGILPFVFSYDQQLRPMLYSAWLATQSFEGQWEHCIFVPFLIGGVLYFRRAQFAHLRIKPSNLGAFCLVAAMFFFWVGVRTEVLYFGYVSIQLCVAGLILWFLGIRWMKALFFCWIFLVFAWPLVFMDNLLAFPLRQVMASLSYHFLDLIGIGTVKVGTAIVSAPDPGAGLVAGQRFSVDIADPCSGIRSLFALMMVSALYGYFMMPPQGEDQDHSKVKDQGWEGWKVEMGRLFLVHWRKWAIFAFSMPLAVLGNFARILMLTFGTMVFGAEVAIGSLEHPTFFHMGAGFLVFIVALVGMVGIGVLLERVGKGRDLRA